MPVHFFDEQEFLPAQPRGRAAPRNPLGNVISERFVPEFERLQQGQAGLESLFLDALRSGPDFGQFRGELGTLAESVAGDIFGAGGAVERAFGEALGRTVETGFGTTSGGFDRARQNILSQGRDTVSDVIGRGALQLAQTASQQHLGQLGNLLGFTSFQGNRLENLRESLFGGAATEEQLRLAEQTLGLNRQIIEESLRRSREESGGGGFFGALGNIAGTFLGSALGPAGSAVGGALGGKLTDLLGL